MFSIRRRQLFGGVSWLALGLRNSMLRPMRRAGLAMACWLSWLGCGGEAAVDLNRRSGSLPSPTVLEPDAGAGGEDRPAPSSADPEPPEPTPFADPGCPPVTTPPPVDECNPLADVSSCPMGESCFPFVDYPSGPCEVESYGTVCRRAGPGTQGDSCARDACAADHICVSTGRGTQCARLCGLAADPPSVCAPGLLCLPIDIEGFGGCL
jgi:hypothetical protein